MILFIYLIDVVVPILAQNLILKLSQMLIVNHLLLIMFLAIIRQTRRLSTGPHHTVLRPSRLLTSILNHLKISITCSVFLMLQEMLIKVRRGFFQFGACNHYRRCFHFFHDSLLLMIVCLSYVDMGGIETVSLFFIREVVIRLNWCDLMV